MLWCKVVSNSQYLFSFPFIINTHSCLRPCFPVSICRRRYQFFTFSWHQWIRSTYGYPVYKSDLVLLLPFFLSSSSINQDFHHHQSTMSFTVITPFHMVQHHHQKPFPDPFFIIEALLHLTTSTTTKMSPTLLSVGNCAIIFTISVMRLLFELCLYLVTGKTALLQRYASTSPSSILILIGSR